MLLSLEDDTVERSQLVGVSSGGDLSTELGAFLRLGAPGFTNSVLAFGMTSIVLFYVGRLGSLQLSIASLASSFFYLTAGSIVIGLALGIETFCGQANGAGNKKMVLSCGRTAICVCTFASALVAILWTRSEWIFVKLGQDPKISKLAALYLQLMIPYMVCDVLYMCLSKVLVCQGIVRPMTIASTVSLLLVPILSWVLIFKTKLAIYGAPITLFLISVTSVAILQYLVRDRKSSRTTVSSMKDWITDGLSGWKKYLVTALPGLATLCRMLPNAHYTLAVMGVSNSFMNILFVIAIALSSASSVRVSNFLGAGLRQSAKKSAWTGLILALILETIMLIIISLLAKPISQIWFVDSQAQALCATVLPVVGLTEWGSGVSYVLIAILRACNRLPIGMAANLGAYWLLGFPTGVWLGFHCQRGVLGFWIGLAAAAVFQSIALFIIFLRLDFEVETKRAWKLTTEHSVL
eukprot:g3643.t1